MFNMARRYTRVLDDDLPHAIREHMENIEEMIVKMHALKNKKNYELMLPVIRLGQGKSFGELAAQKEQGKAQSRQTKPRQASVLAVTDCKFAVLAKADYQKVLDSAERRRTEAIKDFLREIPLLKGLPRGVFKNLHLSVARKQYERGQVVCREGDECEHLYIISKGEFEVSKVVENKLKLVEARKEKVKIKKQTVRSHALNQGVSQIGRKFGHLIEEKKRETRANRPEDSQNIHKLKIALLGVGQLHAEDDAISSRPYQSSLICHTSGSVLYEMTKAEFLRIFKTSSEAWRKAVHHAKMKEHGYVSRCSHYLEVNKEVVEKAKIEIHQAPTLEVVHFKDDKTGEDKVLLQKQRSNDKRERDLDMHFSLMDN